MIDDRPLLHPLLTKENARDREAARRRKQHDTVIVSPSDVEEHEGTGWKIERRLSLKVRLRRLKNADERLENRFWYLLYRLGYTELNQSRDFK